MEPYDWRLRSICNQTKNRCLETETSHVDHSKPRSLALKNQAFWDELTWTGATGKQKFGHQQQGKHGGTKLGTSYNFWLPTKRIYTQFHQNMYIIKSYRKIWCFFPIKHLFDSVRGPLRRTNGLFQSCPFGLLERDGQVDLRVSTRWKTIWSACSYGKGGKAWSRI